MSQNVALDSGDVAIEPFFDATQEVIGASATSLSIGVLSSTTLRCTCGSGDSQQSVAIMGRYRYRTTNVDAAHPGGASGTYDVYVTGSDNNFTGTPPAIDSTTYDFGLVIRAAASPPATAIYRKVAEVDWSGAAITAFRQLQGYRKDDVPIMPTAPLASLTPLIVKGATSQTADLLQVRKSDDTVYVQVTSDGSLALTQNSGKDTLALTNTTANVGLTIGADTNLYRSAADTLATDDALTVGGEFTASVGATLGGSAPTTAADGLTIGTGSNPVTLYRSAADTLKTDDNFAIGINGGKTTLALTDTTADVGLTIGADTNLYRSAANTLKTDDNVIIGINGGKTTLALTDTTANVGLTIGGDTNLYRSAADTLKSDDSLIVSGASGVSIGAALTNPAFLAQQVAGQKLIANSLLTADANNAFFVLGDGKHQWGAGGASAVDTTLYRSAADTLKTDDNFIIGINGGKTTLSLSDTTANVGLTIGADTNLYRSAADTLKTDDSLVVAGTLTAPTVTAGPPGMTVTFDTDDTAADSFIVRYGSSLTKMIEVKSNGTLGFFAATPVARPTYAASNVTTDRTYDANATSMDELADVLGTLIADLRAFGLVI